MLVTRSRRRIALLALSAVPNVYGAWGMVVCGRYLHVAEHGGRNRVVGANDVYGTDRVLDTYLIP